MKIGRICAAVSGLTSEEVVRKIIDAERAADLIEIRFDSLPKNQVASLLAHLQKHRSSKPLIATYRPESQGGQASDDRSSRMEFWERVDGNFWAFDLEEDIFNDVDGTLKHIISYHDFAAGADRAGEVFERLRAKNPQIVKLAYTANDITETIPVFKILESANEVSQDAVLIAMGEAGEITRILGPAHGSRWTYCSVGEATAPGQMSAEALIQLYRVPRLSRNTRVFGVIGDPIARSLSPRIHNAAFDHAGIDSVFIPLLVKDLRGFMNRMVRTASREVELNFAGFAVTMPHKLAIMEHLDEIDDTVAAIGAVNTVEVDGDKLRGYNTDAEGFLKPLSKKFGSLKGARVAILGAGGAARACLFSLNEQGASTAIFARSAGKGSALARELGADFFTMEGESIGSFDIVVNATPIGMAGVTEDPLPIDLVLSDRVRLVYDLVTSPEPTPLVRTARQAGIETITGVEMLVAQAARQFEIWTGERAPVSVMENAAFR